MRRTPPRTWLSMVACLTAFTGQAVAGEPGPSDARQLLDSVARAYRDLAAYSDTGEFVMALTIDGRPEKQSVPLHVSLVRPNRLKIDAGPVRVSCDGTTLTTSVVPFKKYVSNPAPKVITLDTFREGPAGAMLFGGPTKPVMTVLANLLVDEDAAKTILTELGGTLKLEADREVKGTKCRALVIDRPDGPDFRLLVDPATKLLKGIDFLIDSSALAEVTPAGQKIAVEQFGWTPGTVSTEAPKAETYAFQPPAGFAKVESFADVVKGAGAVGESKYRVNDLVGKPAPNFMLSVIEDGGKIKHVSKDDLAGKVVMIDFWATWCGPCLAELPEVQKLIEAYAKDKKDVVIVALSQDERPSELAEVRKLVETTLERKHITLTGTPVGKVALDPSGTIREAFQVEAFPTVVLIDTKGIVQSTHVGFSPDIREVLSKDIDTLLAGKALLKPHKD